jgi:(p)ppGpp synthase/HD superfamily hydrolase
MEHLHRVLSYMCGTDFSNEVCALVEMLTNVSKPEDGNRATRRSIDKEHTACASPDGKTIKLADIIHNTKSIKEHDSNFARIYLKEKLSLLEVLKEGDATLYAIALKQCEGC